MFTKINVASWQRDHHEECYKAEKDGWVMVVRWHPEKTEGGERGFRWSVTPPEGKESEPSELVEEIELAMWAAEQYIEAKKPKNQEQAGQDNHA